MSEWVSPRRTDEEFAAYRHRRFEAYMIQVDNGTLERSVALGALSEEMHNLGIEDENGDSSPDKDN